jgi:hypothetical protein
VNEVYERADGGERSESPALRRPCTAVAAGVVADNRAPVAEDCAPADRTPLDHCALDAEAFAAAGTCDEVPEDRTPPDHCALDAEAFAVAGRCDEAPAIVGCCCGRRLLSSGLLSEK